MNNTLKKILTTVVLGCFAITGLVGCGSTKQEPQQAAPAQPTVAEGPAGTVKIGSKTMAEQMILQEILAQLIENKTNLTVERMEPTAGGTNNIMPAMTAGEMDLYPEYTGTGWMMVLKHDPQKFDTPEAFLEALNKEYSEQLHMQWKYLYGFENTYTLAVRKDTAEKYNLKKISDLAACADQLVFGANFDYFEREDGYNAVCATYGLNFGGTAEVDMGLKYQTLIENKCDVINAYTTDSQIAEYDLITLEDDLHYFTDYHCATVVRTEVLEAYPQLDEALKLMDGLISNEEMTQMNYQLNTEHQLEADIAKAFLQSKGLL